MEPLPERMAQALDASLLATDLADDLAVEGVPFREAHQLIGNLVRAAESLGVAVTEVPVGTAATVHKSLPEILARRRSWEDSVERRATTGGSSRDSVRAQVARLSREFALPESP
jgi:argininosuccinate lyase